jgi:hypothetical protein
MKLKLLFFVMDMLILLVYPIVYMNNRLHQFSRARENYSNKTAVLKVMETLREL